MNSENGWLLPAVIVTALALAGIAILVASRAVANSFNLTVYLIANVIVFIDFLDFSLRLYFRRIGRRTDPSGALETASSAQGVRGPGAQPQRLPLRPYALVASVHNLGDRVDTFLEAMEPYRDHLWVIDDASTDATPIRIRQAGCRCLAETDNRKKPGAIRRLVASLPAGIETVMVLDPDVVVRESRIPEFSALETIIADFQRSGMAALCPRISIKEDGLLGRLQSLEYAMAFVLGRSSLADQSITSGIAIYRRSALAALYERHSLSVYGEDLENAVILMGAGERIYYDGRLVIETDGVSDWRHWFSQRVGWSYGLIKVYLEHFPEIWRGSRRRFITGYQYLVYLGGFGLVFQPLKIVAVVLLALSFANGLGSLFGFALFADWAIADPIYFAAVYAKYLLLCVVAFWVVTPRGERLYVLPIVPLYFFYALLQVLPTSIGYANWISMRAGGRRFFKDHYQDEASLQRQRHRPVPMEKR